MNGNIELIYEYDGAGNKIRDTRFKDDGSLDHWRESEYDLSGNEIKHVMYNENGIVTGWTEHEYDDAGNEVKYIRCSCYGDGSLQEWHEYDAAGEMTQVNCYDQNGDSISYFTLEWTFLQM